jgi:hypothetical protein
MLFLVIKKYYICCNKPSINIKKEINDGKYKHKME